MRYRDFDAQAYLEDRNITYWTEGKNIARGWIGMQCIFPGCSDRSNHLGINSTYNNFSCWKCGSFGQIIELVQEIEACDKDQAWLVLKSFRKDPLGANDTSDGPYSPSGRLEPSTPLGRAESGILPKGSQKKFPIAHLRYLRSRNFPPKKLINDYDLYACDFQHPTYPNKIIAPIYVSGQLISWVAADILRKFQSRTKYRLCPDQLALMPGDRILYNYDSVQKKVLIVEGITDVWTIGPGCIATLRTIFTPAQMAMIARKDVDEAYVLYDPDAEEKANKLSLQLTQIVDKSFFIPIVGGDPAELKSADIVKLRNYLR